MPSAVQIVVFVALCASVPLGMLVLGWLLGPRRDNPAKAMPYESGMDPIHDTRRRFDVRFYLVAIAFLLFDVELLFLYPWALASRDPQGVDAAVQQGWISSRGLVFAEAMVFVGLLALGLVYVWRRGVFRWR